MSSKRRFPTRSVSEAGPLVVKLSIIGAGVTGLAAGIVSGAPVYEQSDGPGGICRSYYLRAGERISTDHAPPDDDAYRFEVGGGHWIFGRDEKVLEWIESLAPLRCYERHAVVRLGDAGVTVPYPLQAHTEALGQELALQIASELSAGASVPAKARTLRDWLQQSFGPTLCERFFFPFHDLYSAGLSERVAPQDDYKSPRAHPPGGGPLGYNAEFRYPIGGLDALVRGMAARCDVRYQKRLVHFDCRTHRLGFSDGSETTYETVVSTLALHRAVELAGLDVGEPADPFTSVLVLNIGAERGASCPDAHWQYEPDAHSSFHRIGFYSNVDRSFLPRASRQDGDHVALYVERAFPPGSAPTATEIAEYSEAVITELRQRDYIGATDVVSPSWVEVAYTWRIPGSRWREKAIAALGAEGIRQVGRYGRWHFQGIADSVREGLAIAEEQVANAAPPREP
jgi:protoporphyrinogen oxidase